MVKDFFFYYGRAALGLAVRLLVLSLLVFYMARLAPGDPLVSYYGERAEKLLPREREQAEEALGLRAPIHVQYLRWLGGALKGDFGSSYKYKRDVAEVIKSRIGNTLLLGGVGFLLIFLFALILGIVCAWQEGRMIDRLICGTGTALSCVPEFWLSLVLILVFAVILRILPAGGAYTVGGKGDAADRIRHLVLPMIVVVTGHLWYYAYMIRNSILEETRKDYVLLAKGKGLGRGKILFGHCLRNVLPSYFSVMAVSFPHILGGTYIVEMVFSYPGIGTLSYESARYQDYNLLMALCLMSGMAVLLSNTAAQIVNERIDPRIRRERERE